MHCESLAFVMFGFNFAQISSVVTVHRVRRSFFLSEYHKLDYEYCKRTETNAQQMNRAYFLFVNQNSLIVFVRTLRPNCNDPNLFNDATFMKL